MITNDFRDLIVAKKEQKQNPEAGLVTPVAYVNPDGSLEVVDPKDFPNSGDIIVAGGYTEHIHDIFEVGELFKLTYYFEDDRFVADDPRSAKFKSYATRYEKKNVERLSKFELCPVIDVEEIPHPSSPFLMSQFKKGHVFLRDKKHLVGPFELNIEEGDLVKVNAVENYHIGSLPQFSVFKISLDNVQHHKLVIDFNFENNSMSYVKGINWVNSEHISEMLDYISDEQLLKWGAGKDLLPEACDQPSRKMLSIWRNSLSDIKNLSQTQDARRERLLKLISTIDSVGENWSDMIRKAIAGNPAIVDEYIERNQDMLLGEIKNELREKAESQAKEEYNVVSKLELEKAELEAKIQALQGQKTSLDEKQSAQLRETLDENEDVLSKKIAELEVKQKDIETEISERLKFLELADDIEDLRATLRYEKRQEENLKAKIETLQDKELPQALTKIKTQLDLLQGVITEEPRNRRSQQKATEIEIDRTQITPTKYIDNIMEYLDNYCNRVIDFDELANILILIQNNFLVILAGPPGSGKTSISYLVAEALGLTGGSFLPVSVARGWTSQRDILGYFNPISSYFQPARTGMYDFLRITNLPEKSNQIMRLILLDEANLSPIEHYWAEFLAMCDTETSRKVDVGSFKADDSFYVSEQVRFIATINHDNTTERLSPRLIDRAPIITLSEHDISSATLSAISNEKRPTQKPICLELMESMFGADNNADFSEVEKAIIDKAFKIMSKKDGGPRIIISPRKVNAMRRYCSVARKILKGQNPLDYAFSQMVLPVIEGFGEDYGARLSELFKIIEPYPKTKALLQDIIDRGQRAHHSYSFFV